MTDDRERTPQEQHVEDLAQIVSETMAGEEMADVVYAAAAVMTYAMQQMGPEARGIVRPAVLKLVEMLSDDAALDESQR